jgi:hypothetical protein
LTGCDVDSPISDSPDRRDKCSSIDLITKISGRNFYLCMLATSAHDQLANVNAMTERELRKLEGTIRTKMEDIKKQRVSLRDSGIGGLMNMLKKADEALYEKILPDYKKMVAEKNIFR